VTNPSAALSYITGLQCVAVCCIVVQCAAVCCSVLQRGAAWCSTLQYVDVGNSREKFFGCAGVHHGVAVWCSVLQCAAVCCSVLQRGAV